MCTAFVRPGARPAPLYVHQFCGCVFWQGLVARGSPRVLVRASMLRAGPLPSRCSAPSLGRRPGASRGCGPGWPASWEQATEQTHSPPPSPLSPTLPARARVSAAKPSHFRLPPHAKMASKQAALIAAANRKAAPPRKSLCTQRASAPVRVHQKARKGGQGGALEPGAQTTPKCRARECAPLVCCLDP